MSGAEKRVSRVRPAKAPPKGGAVPAVRVAAARVHGEDAEEEGTSGARGALRLVRRPAAEAWAKLAEPLRGREGIRIGALGITGSGKTTGIADFLDYLHRERLVDVVLIHDIKGPKQQYDGLAIHESPHIGGPMPDDPTALVLRRRDVDHTPSVEDAARFVKVISYNGIPALLVIDEFKRALSPSGREFEAPSVRELLSEGRALGASLLWTTQLPQRVPTDAYDQSKIIVFRCGRKALAYLIDQGIVDLAAAEVIARLKVGQFVLVTSEDDFDGTVYEVPKPPKRGEQGNGNQRKETSLEGDALRGDVVPPAAAAAA